MINSEYLISKKDEIIKDEILTEQIFEFYKSIYQYHEKFIKKFDESIDNNLRSIIQELPVINADNFTIPESQSQNFKEALEELVEILQTNQEGMDLQSILDTYSDNIEILTDSIKHILTHDLDKLKFISDELKIGTEEYMFILINWIKPYFISLKNLHQENLKNIEYSDWHKQYCPFCGYFADMSKITKSNENRRILHCGLCGHEWQFKRISCTICENEDHEKIGYLEFEDNNLYRIDYCDVCSGYIKTLMIPEQFSGDRYNLTVENIITNFLDASAIEMDYNRP